MKSHLWQVDIEDYAPLIGEEAAERILHKAHRLRGLRVLHVSSTFYGGGVAELLSSETLLAARLVSAIGRNLALIRVTLREAAPQQPRRVLRVIGVVAVGFTGEQHVKRVMHVIVPLRIVEMRRAIRIAPRRLPP